MLQGLPPLVWDGDALPLTSVEPLGAGDFCTCYLVNRSHVLRIAQHELAAQALERELRLLPQLPAHLDVQIPQIVGAGGVAGTRLRFCCYPLVPGAPLEPDVVHALDPPQRAAFVRQLGHVLLQLHRVPVGADWGLPALEKHPALLLERARTCFDSALDSAVWCYYAALQPLYARTLCDLPIHVTLLHGDLSPEHLLGCDGALRGVIDFGDACYGDWCWDLIYILEDYGLELLDALLAVLAPADIPAARLRIQIYQQLNNLEYCRSAFAQGDPAMIAEALDILRDQATTAALV